MGAVGVRAADCLRQRRQSAPVARRAPLARDRGARLARRVPLAHRAPAAGRKRAALADQRRPRARARRLSASACSTPPRSDVGKPYWMTFTMDAHVFASSPASASAPASSSASRRRCTSRKPTSTRCSRRAAAAAAPAASAPAAGPSALIVVELALTLVLLAGAGFMMRSFLTLYRLDLGVDTSRLLTMRLALPLAKYPQREPRTALYQRLDERLRGHRRDSERRRSPRICRPSAASLRQLLASTAGRRQPASSRPTSRWSASAPAISTPSACGCVRGRDVRRRRRHARPRERRSSISGSSPCTFAARIRSAAASR